MNKIRTSELQQHHFGELVVAVGGSASGGEIDPSAVRRQHSAATRLEVDVRMVVCDGDEVGSARARTSCHQRRRGRAVRIAYLDLDHISAISFTA